MRVVKRAATIAALLAAALSSAGRAQPCDAELIDAAVKEAMALTGAKGLAIATIEDGKPVLVRSFGARNAAGASLDTDTVMQVVDEGADRPRQADRRHAAEALPDYGNLDAYGNWGDFRRRSALGQDHAGWC